MLLELSCKNQATKYDCRNIWVLRRFLKVESDDAVRMSAGKLFHIVGPATQNARQDEVWYKGWWGLHKLLSRELRP